MKKFTFVVLVLFLALSPAFGQAAAQAVSHPAQKSPGASADSAAQAKIDPAKEADIRRLLELTGTKALMAQTMQSMADTIKPMLTQSLPPGEYRQKLVDIFFEKFQAKANLQQMVELAIPAYDKHFSAEEIKGLIKFYETPLGQKTITALPQLMSELGQAGQQWGQELGKESMQEVLAEHPDLRQAMQDAAKNQ